LIERMPTGIPGLDNMMEGGLPRPSLILLAGDAGAGKTTSYFGKEICYLEMEEMVEKACRSQDFLDMLEREIDTFHPARIVIENLSVLEDVLKDEYWRFLFKLSHLIKAKAVVALVAEDIQPGAPYPAQMAQVADGIILLQNEEINFARRRSIEIVKMCSTSHHSGKHAVDISVKGLVVYPGL
jgi:circadian clock protein KaiC